MICLLCQRNKATQANSHFVPASLLASNIGKRDKEEAYSININDSEFPFEEFFGRENLKNTEPEIKQNLHSEDYIFCPECEKRLGQIESVILPVLTKEVKDTTKRTNFPEYLTRNGLKYVECLKVDKRKFRIVICSVLWRVSLQHELKRGENILTSSVMESLRSFVYESLYPENGGSANDLFHLALFTYNNSKFDSSRNLVFCDPFLKDPYCFYINEYIIFLSLASEWHLSILNGYGLSEFSVTEEILLDKDSAVRIGFLSNNAWEIVCEKTWLLVTRIFLMDKISEFSGITGKTIEDSRRVLEKRALEIEAETGKKFRFCFMQAFHELKGT